jgi:hypothetical protein
MKWISTQNLLPKEGDIVLTKIDDRQGTRNIARLQRRKNLWFLEDGSMYVYYTPTHWAPLNGTLSSCY